MKWKDFKSERKDRFHMTCMFGCVFECGCDSDGEWNKIFSAVIPEDEDKEYQEGKEDGHIVQGLEHDHELAFQSWHESDKFQDSQESKCPQDRQTGSSFVGKQLHERDNDDDSVKQVESIDQVLIAADPEDLEDHLKGKDKREDRVRDLDRTSQLDRLIMILDPHCYSIDQDGEEDESLKVRMIHQGLD